MEREREARLNAAMIASPVLGLGGVNIPIAVLVGEQQDFGKVPGVGDSPEQRLAKVEKMRREQAEEARRALREWLPADIDTDAIAVDPINGDG